VMWFGSLILPQLGNLQNNPMSRFTCQSMKVMERSKDRALLGQVSDLDFRLLRVFKSVAECGGMTAAELELNIGTSTVSRHIKDLETRLALTLCRRGRGGFALTADGDRVYREILKLLVSVETFRGSIDDIHRRLGGQIEVAVFDKTVTNPEAKIYKAIEQFSEAAPDVRLSVHVASINTIERGIIDGSFHVGIIPTHRNSRSLSYADLFGETMLLYCGAGHRLYGKRHDGLTWSRLRGYAFAGLGYHSPNMEISHRERLHRTATAYDQEAIATLILSGRYLGFLPAHYADSLAQAGDLQAIFPSKFKYSCRFAGVVRRSPEPSRAVQSFRRCLAAVHHSPS
jgi:LysR family transcriptional regulator, transcriptional activator for bauABCD operon